MKKRRVLSIALTVIVAGMGAVAHDDAAGDRIKPACRHPLAGSVIAMAWHEKQTIHVAVANRSESPHCLTIATGTSDMGTVLYAARELAIPERAITLLQFPALTHKTATGSMKMSNFVFVSSTDEDMPGPVSGIHIQNIGRDHPPASLKEYLVTPGDEAVFTYTASRDGARRIILVATSIAAGENVLEGRVRWPCLTCADEREVKTLKRSLGHYTEEIIEKMGDHFCFVVDPDEDRACTVRYTVPDIDGVRMAQIPVYIYRLWPGGNITAGGGNGLVFMLYNPDQFQVSTSDGELQDPTGKLTPASE